MNANPVIIAIDGPSASGKSTVARGVADALGFTYVDSGSLYRGLTWQVLREGFPATDEDKVGEMLGRIDIALRLEDHTIRFTIDGVDPGNGIRSMNVVDNVSDIAAMPRARRFVVDLLRGMTRFGDIVVEGRDIGSVVFPDTPFKFYLDADPEERARRRFEEQEDRGSTDTVDTFVEHLNRRDQKDRTRKTAPLQVASGAKVINTTSMSIAEVVEEILREIKAAR